MTEPAPLALPATPTNIEEAKAYLGWVADHALTGDLDRHRAEAAVKAIAVWIRAEDYTRQIRDMRKQLDALKKAVPRNG